MTEVMLEADSPSAKISGVVAAEFTLHSVECQCGLSLP